MNHPVENIMQNKSDKMNGTKRLPEEDEMYDDCEGTREACAWRNGTGWIKIQFRDPGLSRKFQRCGVLFESAGYGVAGGYLRIFNVQGKTLGWFKRWLKRNDT